MNILTKSVCGMLLVMLSAGSWAGVKVIAHSSTTGGSVSANAISDIFLGKAKALPNGTKAIPIDQEQGEDAHSEFYSTVVGKEGSQLKAYWARLIFTGKGHPPQVAYDDDEVLEMVMSNPGFIGYISANADVSGVKVLLSSP